ncbi:MAG: tRNA (adenosine(37)-N6)-threonylcarbamoyltransferase complex dimerization subunit type 1 TsaB [Pseudoflavonifractor sp.]
MKILALESSAIACSVALCEDEKLIAQSFQNNGLTHSRTLMPMAEHLLRNCGVTLHEVDIIAVAAGPGSFTGLRIGVAAAKGLAWPENKPCAGVSTLEAMAWTVAHMGGELCPVMDARRGQVYHARFAAAGGGPVRLTADRAIRLTDLAEELKMSGKEQVLVGDGAAMCYNRLQELGIPVRIAPPHLQFQCAWGVARAALEQANTGTLTDANGLAPSYHRLPQAERERMEQNTTTILKGI